MPIEVESPEEQGYSTIRRNLGESSVRDATVASLASRARSTNATTNSPTDATPNATTALLDDLANRVLWYGDHRGDGELRTLIAGLTSTMTADDVLVTAGAAMALFLVHTTFLNPGDEVVVFHPNYATNIETPRAIGAKVRTLELQFRDGYRPNPDRLEGLVSEHTKLISITDPHNPTGMCLTGAEREHIVALAERHHCPLLVDETYRDLAQDQPKFWAAEESTYAISVSSLSKSYGLPGIRVGWALTQNTRFKESLLAAKEQIMICGSILDETVAVHALRQRAALLNGWRDTAARHLAIVRVWMHQHPHLEWIEPRGGVVCFPRIRDPFAFDIDLFHRHLRNVGETFVGPGHWFEVDRRSFRLGYGWPTEEELREGLRAIDQALVAARVTSDHPSPHGPTSRPTDQPTGRP